MSLHALSFRRLSIARTAASVVGFSLLLAAFLGGACAHWRAVFYAPGQVAFVDGDCYARMTRVEAVLQRPGRVVREHGFENHPVGTRPHVTAPLDYLIAAIAGCLRVFSLPAAAARDLAGAWVSPLLGVGTLAFLWVWAQREFRHGGWWSVPALVAISPILAHGFALGRPDHQSLVLLCVAVALAAEVSQWRRPSRNWGIASGAAWALALWTSLYEPLVLVVAVIATGIAFGRSALGRAERWPGLVLGGGILLFALAVEGVRIALPGAGDRALFRAWAENLGELRGALPWSGLLLSWTGLSLWLAPLLLFAAWQRLARDEKAATRPTRERVALALACWLVLTWALTCWQVRWGYFLALVMALSLPWQFWKAFGARSRALSFLCCVIAMAPVLAAFDRRLDGTLHGSAADTEQARAAGALREVADFLRRDGSTVVGSGAPRGLLTPWWDAAALAYWTGLPAIAGSSHGSLPGIADSARFFLLPAEGSDGGTAARELLRVRRVRWVVAGDPDRVLPAAAALLGVAASNHGAGRETLGAVLARDPLRAPAFLRLAFANPDLKVYAVEPTVFAEAP